MLNNTITLTWSIDGVAAAAARELTKVEQTTNGSKFVLTTFLDGTVAKSTTLTTSKKNPKVSGDSLGVKRGITKVADQAEIINAKGVTVVVEPSIRVESALPVGITTAEWKGLKALLIAAINDPSFDKVHINQEV